MTHERFVQVTGQYLNHLPEKNQKVAADIAGDIFEMLLYRNAYNLYVLKLPEPETVQITKAALAAALAVLQEDLPNS